MNLHRNRCVFEKLANTAFSGHGSCPFGKNDGPPSCVGAADGGYVPRFLRLFLALSFLRFDGESTLPPTAANAHR
jgi:hypothetical protein